MLWGFLSKTFWSIAKEFHLVDAWRATHIKEKVYTFYSNLHKTWSRIDACWIPISWIKVMKTIDILPRTFADQSPVILQLNLPNKISIWRMNTSLLQNEDFKKEVMQEMSWYFKENKTPDVPMRTVWDAGKAKLRGIVIKHAARQKRGKYKNTKN